MALRIVVALMILIGGAVTEDSLRYDGYYRLIIWQEFKLGARIAHVEAHRLFGLRP